MSQEVEKAMKILAVHRQRYGYDDVAGRMNVSVRTVMRWVVRGCVPSPEHRYGRTSWNAVEFAQVLAGPSFPGTFVYLPTKTSEAAKRGVADGKARAAKSRRKATKREGKS